jgi:peptide-methionine (R)-S-oxide reductase
MSASLDHLQQKAPSVNLSDVEWKEKLTAEQYRVLRQKGTEDAGSGEFNKKFETGTYKCAGCGQELYE